MSEHLSALDAFFVYIESDTAPMHIGVTGIYKGRLPFKRYVQFVEDKLHLIPRYHQRVVFAPLQAAHPSWEEDTDFDIRRHIHRVELDAPGSDVQLRHLSERIFSGRLSLDKPVWEQYVVYGLAGGNTAIITKLHHCLADGLSSVKLLLVMHDGEADVRATKHSRRTHQPAPSLTDRLFDALKDNLRAERQILGDVQQSLGRLAEGLTHGNALSSVKEVARVARNYIGHMRHLPFNIHHLSGRKKMGWCSYPLADLKAAALVLGGTVNDAVLTIVGGGVRGYLKSKGENVDGLDFGVMIPVGMHHAVETGPAGNRVSVTPVKIPLGVATGKERFAEIHRQTRALKAAHIADWIHVLVRLAQGAPPALHAQLGKLIQQETVTTALAYATSFPVMNAVCTNVPGPQQPLFTLGHECLAMHPYMPVIAEMGLGFACASYKGQLYISAVADAAAVPDMQLLKRHLDRACAELLRTTVIQPAGR